MLVSIKTTSNALKNNYIGVHFSDYSPRLQVAENFFLLNAHFDR